MTKILTKKWQNKVLDLMSRVDAYYASKKSSLILLPRR